MTWRQGGGILLISAENVEWPWPRDACKNSDSFGTLPLTPSRTWKRSPLGTNVTVLWWTPAVVKL